MKPKPNGSGGISGQGRRHGYVPPPEKTDKKNGASLIACSVLVRETGLEPVRHKHTPLKRACLPIPALALNKKYYTIIFTFVNVFLYAAGKLL